MDKALNIEQKSYQSHWFLNEYPETRYQNYVNHLGTSVTSRLPKKRGFPNIYLLDRRQRNLRMQGVTESRLHHGSGLEHQADKRDPYGLLDSHEKPHKGYLDIHVSQMGRGIGGNNVAGNV